ncbi:hypothetical protein COR52_06300 [Vibrio mediterranei]|uniref:Uncharacterized protein n=1 Tax=Vibrio mediterranei TaxID=689 RepID=A0ABX5DGB2_9VIBR|nr:hypothetical protein COR52_06300 [Vibrio mediterranei]PRQ68108.1 hypothetical protein COR51_06525 [Vibrio mediterranei]
MTSLMANPMPTIDTVCSADQLIEAPNAPSPAGTANIPMLVIMKATSATFFIGVSTNIVKFESG